FPSAREERVDVLLGRDSFLLRRALESGRQEEVARAERDVRRVVRDERVAVARDEAAARRELLEEADRVADVVIAAVLRVAAVGGPVGRRRVEAAVVARGRRAVLAG